LEEDAIDPFFVDVITAMLATLLTDLLIGLLLIERLLNRNGHISVLPF